MNFLVYLIPLFGLITFGQEKHIVLPEKGNSIKNIIPSSWSLLSKNTGDLNNDNIADLVFVIQNTDISNIESNENSMGRETIDLNPRILGVYFGSKNGLLYKYNQFNNFIILQDSPTMDEPLKNLEITPKGLLKIQFHFWFSAGSWSMSNHTYKFRFQNKQFELIGYDSNETHRGSGEITNYSINFSTQKIKIIKDHMSNDITPPVEWKTFKLKKLKSLKELNEPFDWEFMGLQI